MSVNEDENNDLISENMEQEYKVNVEETSINLGYVKKELDEEELEYEENQYKIALNFENIFGESSIEQRNNRDSLIGFLDDNVIMETGCVKLEDIKEEDKDLIQKTNDLSHCNKCGDNYQGYYCLNCSSLSHILNNLTPNINSEAILNTAPINMLEIREVSMRQAVFALQTLPKGIMLGPFEGVPPIESSTGLQWKIKDKKLVNDQNGNWMKYIESVANDASTNLDVFQIDGILYFETSREIQEGEELLVCYGVEEEEVFKSDKDEEFYLVPVKKEEYPRIFACTLCCLGFRLEECLVEHKSKCPQGYQGGTIEDFVLIQCPYCKVWLEKQEYLRSHMLHCLENYNRLCHNTPNFQRKSAGEIDETYGTSDRSTQIDENRSSLTLTEVIQSKYSDGIGKGYFSEKKHKSSECSFQTNYKSSLKLHLNTHSDVNPFECDICNKKFNRKSKLKLHIRNQHVSEKELKCSKCHYQTNDRSNLKRHLNTHSDIKPFKCHICENRFTQKIVLNRHVRNLHSNTSEKEYKCSECPYETNNKNHLTQHLNTHYDIKPFNCAICKKVFNYKSSLKLHIRDKHSNTSEKKYKCSECSYQTNDKSKLTMHLNTHTDIKPFECEICKKKFTQKNNLNQHIRIQHSKANGKKYKCSECVYQTNYKRDLTQHLNTHSDIKPFECDICKRKFTQKKGLKLHIENKHSNAHPGIKPFECDICKKGFTQSTSLRKHIRNLHSNTSEKEHKCSQCSYDTNYKSNLRRHLNTHKVIRM